MPLLVTLAIACFAGAVSIRVIDPVVADMARDWAVTPAVIALLASAFAFPYALSQPLLGPAGDAYGKSRVIKIGLGVLAVATVVVAVAPTLEMMFIARAVAGVAGGAIIPVALATVGDRVPFAERQVALSHILSAMLVAQLVSLTGSGLIADAFGWRWSLAASAAIAAIAFAAAMIALKPRPGVARASLSYADLRESYADVFANPRAKFCYLAVFVEGMLIFGLLPYVAVMLEARGAGGVAEAGFVIAGMGVGGLLYTLSISAILPRIGGMFNAIRIGGAAAAVGYAGVALAGPWPFEMLAFGVMGFGFYAVHNVLQTQATELSPDHRGAAVALHAFFFFIGHAAGPPVYAALFASIGPSLTILSCGIVLAVGAFVLAEMLQTRAPVSSRLP